MADFRVKEYLVVLGIFIVVSVIFVGVMGGLPGFNGVGFHSERDFNQSYLDEVNNKPYALYNECHKNYNIPVIFSRSFMTYNFSTKSYELVCMYDDLSGELFTKRIIGG